MKKILIIVFLLSIQGLLLAQRFDKNSLQFLKEREDSLKKISKQIVWGTTTEERVSADSSFTVQFVQTLKTTHSFYYPFDSIVSISIKYAPDSAFRIFTWQLVYDENYIRKHGAIQINTKNGSLKLFPLVDRFESIENALDTITSNLYWIGSIYYKIILKEFKGKKYYTLLGYDEYSNRMTKKWIEVISFDTEGKPIFGGKFRFDKEKEVMDERKQQTRFVLEFKRDARARITYDDEMDLIVYDHLVSETNEPDKKYTYVPDGDYEAFKWVNGEWIHITKVFNQRLRDGEAPLEQPIFDNESKKTKIQENKKSTKKKGGG